MVNVVCIVVGGIGCVVVDHGVVGIAGVVDVGVVYVVGVVVGVVDVDDGDGGVGGDVRVMMVVLTSLIHMTVYKTTMGAIRTQCRTCKMHNSASRNKAHVAAPCMEYSYNCVCMSYHHIYRW